MKTDKVLLSEKEIVGVGALYRNMQFLAECEYSLTLRKSLINLKNVDPQDDCVIITIMGILYPLGKTGGMDAIQDGDNIGNTFVLHLNEDFLIPVSLMPAQTDSPVHKVFGRILTKFTPYLSTYL